jgi:hypothetical protein
MIAYLSPIPPQNYKKIGNNKQYHPHFLLYGQIYRLSNHKDEATTGLTGNGFWQLSASSLYIPLSLVRIAVEKGDGDLPVDWYITDCQRDIPNSICTIDTSNKPPVATASSQYGIFTRIAADEACLIPDGREGAQEILHLSGL